MENNTCILYDGVNEVYDSLLAYCVEKGFKVKESDEKFYFIRGKKTSLFFWKNARLELEILMTDKNKVQVKCMMYKFGARQHQLENELITEIESLF